MTIKNDDFKFELSSARHEMPSLRYNDECGRQATIEKEFAGLIKTIHSMLSKNNTDENKMLSMMVFRDAVNLANREPSLMAIAQADPGMRVAMKTFSEASAANPDLASITQKSYTAHVVVNPAEIKLFDSLRRSFLPEFIRSIAEGRPELNDTRRKALDASSDDRAPDMGQSSAVMEGPK